MSVRNNSNLYSLSLSEITNIGTHFTVQNNPVLSSFSVTKLVNIGGSLTVINTAVTTFDGLVKVESITENVVIRQNPSLTTFGTFSSTGDISIDTLRISNNGQLQTLNALNLEVKKALILRNNKLVTGISENIDFPINSFGAPLDLFEITNNDQLTDLTQFFTGPGYIAITDFVVEGNDALEFIGQEPLYVTGSIVFRDNISLLTLGNFGFVQTLSGDLILENNAALTSTEQFGQMMSVAGDVIISGNSALSETSFDDTSSDPSVQRSGLYGFRNLISSNRLIIDGNAGIETLGSFTSLDEVYDSLAVVNNSLLSDCTSLPCQVTVRGATVNTLNPAVAIFGNTGDCADKAALRNDPDLDGRACIQEARVLPIELLAFTGRLADDHVALVWETATETDNSHFFVERSTNGFTFTAIGRVEGAGNSTEAIRYGYPDYDYPAGRIYYRLRQVDFDGTESVSETVTILSEEAVTDLQAYPNPVAAGTPVNIAIGKEWARDAIYVDVFSADGRRAYSLTFPAGDRLQVPTTGLGTGLHLLRISNGNRTETQRLVVR